jgi:hypothetical protein
MFSITSSFVVRRLDFCGSSSTCSTNTLYHQHSISNAKSAGKCITIRYLLERRVYLCLLFSNDPCNVDYNVTNEFE